MHVRVTSELEITGPVTDQQDTVRPNLYNDLYLYNYVCLHVCMVFYSLFLQNPSSAMSVGTGTISPSLTSPSSVNPSSVNPSILLEDPNYQTIPSPSSGHHHHHQQQQQQQQQSPALIEPSYQSVPAASSQHNQSPPMIEPNYASVPTTSPDPTPSTTNPPAPTIIYQVFIIVYQACIIVNYNIPGIYNSIPGMYNSKL